MKYKTILENLALKMEWVGAVAVLTMLITTLVSVISAKVFLSPMRGATEIVGFAQITAISLACTICLFQNRHIAVDFFVNILPKIIKNSIGFIVLTTEMLFFALLCKESYRYGASLYRAGEMTSGAHISLYPFAYIIAFGAAVACLYFTYEIYALFAAGRGAKDDSN